MNQVMKVRHDLKPEFSKEIEIQKQTQAEMKMHEEKIKKKNITRLEKQIRESFTSRKDQV